MCLALGAPDTSIGGCRPTWIGGCPLAAPWPILGAAGFVAVETIQVRRERRDHPSVMVQRHPRAHREVIDMGHIARTQAGRISRSVALGALLVVATAGSTVADHDRGG